MIGAMTVVVIGDHRVSIAGRDGPPQSLPPAPDAPDAGRALQPDYRDFTAASTGFVSGLTPRHR